MARVFLRYVCLPRSSSDGSQWYDTARPVRYHHALLRMVPYHTTATKRDQNPVRTSQNGTMQPGAMGKNGGRKGWSKSTCTSAVLIGTHAVIIITNSFIVSLKYRSIRTCAGSRALSSYPSLPRQALFFRHHHQSSSHCERANIDLVNLQINPTAKTMHGRHIYMLSQRAWNSRCISSLRSP